MSENLKKAQEMVQNDETLQAKVADEAARLAETMEGKDRKEITAQAIKNVLGVEVSTADLDFAEISTGEMTPEELEKVSGGDLVQSVKCFFGSHETIQFCSRSVPGRDYTVRGVRCNHCFKKFYQKVYNDGKVQDISESDYYAY